MNNTWWLGTAVAAAVLVPLGAGLLLVYRRRTRLSRILGRIAWSRLEDVIVPDDVDGEIHLDLLLLVPAGLVVLEIRHLSGTLFWGEQLENWTALDGARRTVMKNPLAGLQARIHAVRALAPGQAVEGFVLLLGDVAFSGEPPPDVLTLEALSMRFPARGKARPPQTLAAAWQALRQKASPA